MEVEEELQAVQAAYPELLVAQRNPLALSFDGKYLISVEITDSYPSEVPVVLLKVPWLSPERETEIAERARSQCSVGEPMLFALVSLIHEEVPPEPPRPAELSSLCIHPLLITADKELAFGPSEPKPQHTSHVSKEAPIEEEKDLFEAHFISGPVITDRKSSFQAHLARVQNQEDITRLLSLVKDHRKVGRATHNIWAYVISADEYDFNDDGVRIR